MLKMFLQCTFLCCIVFILHRFLNPFDNFEPTIRNTHYGLFVGCMVRAFFFYSFFIFLCSRNQNHLTSSSIWRMCVSGPVLKLVRTLSSMCWNHVRNVSHLYSTSPSYKPLSLLYSHQQQKKTTLLTRNYRFEKHLNGPFTATSFTASTYFRIANFCV